MTKQSKPLGGVENTAEDPEAKPTAKPGKEKNVWQVTAPSKQILLAIQEKIGGTQEQVLGKILEVYFKVDSGSYHNEQDTKLIAELTEQVNHLGNSEETQKLTEVNQKLTEETEKLTKVNSELTEKNRKLTEQLSVKQLEVNSVGEKLTAKDLELDKAKREPSIVKAFGQDWDILTRFARGYKQWAPEQLLLQLWLDYKNDCCITLPAIPRKWLEVAKIQKENEHIR